MPSSINCIMAMVVVITALIYGGVAWLMFGMRAGFGTFGVMFVLLLLTFGLCDAAKEEKDDLDV